MFTFPNVGFLRARWSSDASRENSLALKVCLRERVSGARFRVRESLLTAGLIALFAAMPLGQAELSLKEADIEQSTETAAGWKKQWAVEEGFALELDTKGYNYPTAIAFVPNPGAGPKDPLYFVTELRGTIKVVTNDRTIYTFAEGFLEADVGTKPPKEDAEFGLAGLCLAPEQGYVFATFAYQDGGTLRNNVIRFDTRPATFALRPTSQQAFTEVFAAYESGVSHHIGGCSVSGDMLHVGIGDGWVSHLGSQRLNTLQGKVIRMTLEGKPVAANPFYEDEDVHKAANYIWAYGMRNPFSLNVIGGQIIVAENGVHADRFLRVRRGENYLWDGSDKSISANADYVFLESVGPVQMDYLQHGSPSFPAAFKDGFYLALSREDAKGGGIMRVPYSVKKGRMTGTPAYLVRAADAAARPVTGLAFGPDGLYFAPLLPTADGVGAVLKLDYDPKRAHGLTLQDQNALAVATADGKSIQDFMHRTGCFGCHKVEDALMGTGGTKGPMLGGKAMIKRIQQRVSSPEFLKTMRELDARDEAPFGLYKEARNQVARAMGTERVRLYVKYQILEPRFESSFSGMPNLGLTETEAEAITNYLMGDLDRSIMEKLMARLPKEETQRSAAILGAGFLVGLPIWLGLSGLAWLMLRRRRS